MHKIAIAAIVSLLLSHGTIQNSTLPLALRIVGVTSTSSDSLVVEWLIKQDGENLADDLDFEIHLSKQYGFIPDQTTRKVTVQKQLYATVTGLQAETLYYVTVVAKDDKGMQCWSNQLSGTTSSGLTVRTAATVKTLDSDAGLQLAEGSLTLPSGTGQTYQPGDIVAGTTGNGFLRKVVSSTDAGGTVTVVTEPASLNEVYEQLDFSTNIRMESLDDSVLAQSGGSITKISSSGGTRKVQWPTGLTLIQPVRNDMKTPVNKQVPGTVKSGSLSVISKSGKYMKVSMTEINGGHPGKDVETNAVIIPLTASELSDVTYKFDKNTLNVSPVVCGLWWENINHPDSYIDSVIGVKVWTEGNPSDGYVLNPTFCD